MITKQLRLKLLKSYKFVFIPCVFTHCSNVIKELVHAFSCAYIELWMHLGSLESTLSQEARVALGYRLEQLLRPIYTVQLCRMR